MYPLARAEPVGTAVKWQPCALRTPEYSIVPQSRPYWIVVVKRIMNSAPGAKPAVAVVWPLTASHARNCWNASSQCVCTGACGTTELRRVGRVPRVARRLRTYNKGAPRSSGSLLAGRRVARATSFYSVSMRPPQISMREVRMDGRPRRLLHYRDSPWEDALLICGRRLNRCSPFPADTRRGYSCHRI